MIAFFIGILRWGFKRRVDVARERLAHSVNVKHGKSMATYNFLFLS